MQSGHRTKHLWAGKKISQIIRQLFCFFEGAIGNYEAFAIFSRALHGNRARGVPDDILKGKEKELVEGAGSLAAHRLKTNFILSRIAEREKIEVSREELDARIREEAARYDISVDKMRKELQEHDGLNGLAEQLLLGKTLDFLKANVSVEKTQEPAAVEEKS